MKETPLPLVWIRRLSLFMIITNTIFIVYLLFLSFAQPTGGWSGGFNQGFLEALTGVKGTKEISPEVAGEISAVPLISVIVNIFILYSIRRRKLKLLTVLTSFLVLIALTSGSAGPLLLSIIMLILAFNKSLKENSQSTPTK